MEARVSCKTDTVHPRPQLRRETWMDLNGKWDFAVQADEKKPEEFDRTILVPYCPESALSSGRRLSARAARCIRMRMAPMPISSVTPALTQPSKETLSSACATACASIACASIIVVSVKNTSVLYRIAFGLRTIGLPPYNLPEGERPSDSLLRFACVKAAKNQIRITA